MQIGPYEVNELLSIPDVGFNHEPLRLLKEHGFVREVRQTTVSFKQTALLIPAEGVSLDVIQQALQALVDGEELPALPVKSWQE